MPISAPGSRAHQRGLTLIEVLAVIGVAALMTAVVLTTVAPPASDAETAARDFARQATALADRAVVSGRTLGLSGDDGLSVHRYDAEEGWVADGAIPLPEALRVDLAVGDEMLPPDPVPTGTLVIYRPPGEAAEEDVPPPPVAFGATGEVTPFAATFAEGDETWIVRVGPFAETEVARDR